jgi:hypothetical protein
MKSVTIESCTEGFLVWNLDDNGYKTKESYAVSQDKLIQKVKELLGITDKSKTVIVANNSSTLPAFSGSTYFHTANLAMAGDVSKIETKLSPGSPAFTFTEIAAFEVSVQPVTIGKSIYWLHPGGKKVRISRDGYPHMFIHANISDLVYLYEHSSEQKAIVAYGKTTYGNKGVILRRFLKDVPLSALIGDNHDNNDVIIAKKEEQTGQEDGSCDDAAFDSCANNAPENCKFCRSE